MSNHRGQFLILGPIIFCYILYRVFGMIHLMNMANTRSTCSPDIFPRLIFNYRRCLIDQVSKVGINAWSYMEFATQLCLRGKLKRWRMLNIHVLRNNDDKKFVILPQSRDKTTCTQITLGVGGDISAEMKLRRLMPQCKHFGADPILESGQIFRNIGEYFEFAVSHDSGIANASVLNNGIYEYKAVKTVSFQEFVSMHVKAKLIDYLWIDNEGAEYKIFERDIMRNSTSFTICQISVEMHSPLQQYNMNHSAFDAMILSILSRSHFVPVWSEIYGRHTRSFYINAEDKVCMEKYSMYGYCD